MDGNGHNLTQKAPAPPMIELKISLDPRTGMIGVNIANELLANHLLAYGMLEVARQTIQKHVEERAKDQRIIPANVLPLVRPA